MVSGWYFFKKNKKAAIRFFWFVVIIIALSFLFSVLSSKFSDTKYKKEAVDSLKKR
jgi:hypothetical protein